MNYDEMFHRFELLKKIIQPTGQTSLVVNLDRIEKIIKEDIPKAFEQNPPTDFHKLYQEFVGEYDRFHDFILFDRLIGKNVVALGGGFKSGKSTFLNNFILKEMKLLPTGIDPSTSVPAYIIHKNETLLFGINLFDAKIELQIDDIKLISHKFDEQVDENMGKLSLGHFLKSIFIAVPNQEYKNIAFMDTPGYSKEESEHYFSAKTDEQTEYLHLNSSNYIFWFVAADHGTIPIEDIELLSKLKREIPLVIIINKADKRKDDIHLIKEKIRDICDSKGIKFEDILAFSSKFPKEFDSLKIQSYLYVWNKRIEETNFAKNFKVLFIKCMNYYDKFNELEQKKLTIIQEVLRNSSNDHVEKLTLLQKECSTKIKRIEQIELTRKRLQEEFFAELNLISNKVGIKMPEPSELALIQEKMKDPFEVLKDYKKKHNILNNPERSITLLEEAFMELDCTVNKQLGGSEYTEVLYRAIQETLILDKSKLDKRDKMRQDMMYREFERDQVIQPLFHFLN